MGIKLLLKLNTNKIYYIVLCGFIFLTHQKIASQTLGQDSNGFSAIVLPSSTLNLDTSNDIITVSFSQLHKLSKIKELNDEKFSTAKCFIDGKNDLKKIKTCINNAWIKDEKNYKKENTSLLYGLELLGASKTGLSVILNDEILVNSGRVSGILGFHFRNKKYNKKTLPNYIKYKTEQVKTSKEIETLESKLNSLVQKMLINGMITSDKKNRLLLFNSLKETEHKIDEVKTRIEKLSDFESTTKIKIRLNELDNQKTILKTCLNKINAIASTYNPIPELEKLDDITIKKLRSEIGNINQLIDDLNTNFSTYKKIILKTDLSKYLENDTWSGLKKEIITNLTYLKSDYNYLSNVKKTPNKELIKLFNQYLEKLKEFKKIKKEIKKIENKQLHFNKHTFYTKGGLIGTSFLYDLNNGATSLNDRIIERGFQGTKFELGWTHQFKSFNFLGVNLSKSYTDNSNLLKPKTFKFKTIDTTVSPNLETSSSITAVSGTYDRFDEYQISADYVGLIPLRNKSTYKNKEKNAEVFLNLNPYVRHRFYGNSALYRPNTSLGLGVYAFKAKKNTIVGGLFIEANDLFNNNREKAINFTKQVNIGLVFKYSLNSFNPTD